MNFNNHLFTYPELNGSLLSLLPSNRPHPPLIKVNPSSWYQPHYYHFITCTLNNSPPISSLHLFSEGLPEYTRNKTCQEEIQVGNFICHPLQLTTRNCLPTSFPWTTTTTTSVFTCSPNNNLNSVVCPHFLGASPPSKKHEQRHAQEDVLPPTRAPTLSLS